MVALSAIPTPSPTLSLTSNPFTCPANPSATCTIRTTQTNVRLAAVTIPPGTEALSSYRSMYSASSASKYNFDKVIFPDDEQPSNIVYDYAGNPVEVLTFFKDEYNPGMTVSVPCCGDFAIEAYDVEWGNRATASIKEINATATGTGTGGGKGDGCTEVMKYTVVPYGQPFSDDGDFAPENNCVQPPSTIPFAPTRGVPVTKTVVRQLVPPTDPPGNDGGHNGSGDDDGGDNDGGDDDGGDDDDGNPTPQPIETGGGNNGGSTGGSNNGGGSNHNGGGSNNGGLNGGSHDGSSGGGSTGGDSDSGNGGDHGGSSDSGNSGDNNGNNNGNNGGNSGDNNTGNGNGSGNDSGSGTGDDTGSGSDDNSGSDNGSGSGSGSEQQTGEPPAPTSGAENGAGLAFGKGISWAATLGLAFVVAVGML